MSKLMAMVVLFLVIGLIVLARASFWVINRAGFWKFQIAAYRRQDRRNPPPRNGIVFVGSSSIRFWRKLEEDMHPLPVLNRGFGGAHLSHVNQFAPEIILPYAPRMVVLYAGENDLGRLSGKTPEEVFNDFREFVRLIHNSLPETRIYFLSIKASPLRSSQRKIIQRANELVENYVQGDERLRYVDVSSPMLDEHGRLQRDLLLWDRLHPSRKCYALWTGVLKPLFQQDLEKPTNPGRVFR